MSRRPRAPLSLRLLAREESTRTALEIDAGETTRLADPVPETGTVTLAPPLESSLHALVPDIPPTPGLRAGSARRRGAGLARERHLRAAPRRAEIPAAEGREGRAVRTRRRARSRSRRSRRACPHGPRPRSCAASRPCRSSTSSARCCGSASRRCTARREQRTPTISRSSASTTACRWVRSRVPRRPRAASSCASRQARVPAAVISWSGAVVRAGRSSRPRCRRRSLPNRRMLAICQPRTLKFCRARADAEHKEAPGNAGVPRP